jgi:hypothetical protein
MEGIFEMLHGRSAFFPGKETLSPGEKNWPDKSGAVSGAQYTVSRMFLFTLSVSRSCNNGIRSMISSTGKFRHFRIFLSGGKGRCHFFPFLATNLEKAIK